MKEEKKITISLFALLILGIFLGILGTLAYKDLKLTRDLNGVYLNANLSYQQAKDIASLLDKKGDWVCINVAYKMSPELAYDTCVHECSHKAYSEIFAEYCENDIKKCNKLIGEDR